jgi:hypothetical protein
MIILDPENLGCGRKLPHTDLAALQDYVASNFPTVVRSQDSAIVPTEYSAATRASSIDRTVRFCSDVKTFVRAAIHHACNDLVASRARPSLASISLGFSSEDVVSRNHFSVTHEIVEVLSEDRITVGKLHSFIDTETNLTVNVEGGVESSTVRIASEGSIYLSKPLGALKAIYLAEIGHQVAGIELAADLVASASMPLLPIIQKFAVGATDVSGFGLLHAVEQYFSWHHMRGKIELGSVPVVDPVVKSIDVDCLDRGYGYQYRLVDAGVNDGGSNVGVLSEINGPLLIFVASEDELGFQKYAPDRVTRIGEWRRD